MCFVDDFTAWIVGPTIKGNTQAIQDRILLVLAKWERTSGTTFEAEKTQFIHLQGRLVKTVKPALIFKGAPIQPQPTMKLLGVLLDRRLTYREHIAKCVNKAYKAVAA